MRRSILGKIVLSAVVAALVMPLSASAYLGANPILSEGYWNTLAGHLGFGADPTPPAGVTPPDSASATLLKARIALETMPNLSELGTLTLGTGPLQIGWRINSSRFVTFDLDVGSSWVGTYVNGTKWSYNPGFGPPELAEALGLPYSGGMMEPYWILHPTNYLNNPNTGFYFECEPGIPWNSCQQWSGYNQDANTEWLQALRDTAEDVPMAIRVRDFYCNKPNTPERKCKGLFLTQEGMRNLISNVDNVTYTGQSYTHSTSNFVPATHGYGDTAATRARSELLADGDTALYIGDLLDQDWDGLDSQTLLEAYTPQLRFSADEVYRPARADLSTDTFFTDDPYHTNRLEDGWDTPIASADPNEIYEDTYHPPMELDDLSLPYLGDNLGNADYEINHANHLGNQEHSSADDYVRMLDEHPGEYNDVVYGRLVTHPTSGEKIAEYWFYYYHNPKTWTGVGAHEGDWESMQIRFSSTGVPITVAYSRHQGARRCLWSTVMKSNGTHPVVWPAKDSHANYFFPGEYALNFSPGVTVIDKTAPRGDYEYLDPSLDDDALNESWVNWEGRWGGSGEGVGGAGASPRSPGSPERNQWDEPFSWHSDQPFGCVEDMTFRRDGASAPELHSTALFESSTRPALPRVTARLSSTKRRVTVNYCFKSMPRGRHVRPWRISVGVDNVRDSLPPLMFGWPVKTRCGKIRQTVGPADPPYRLLVRVTAPSGAHSRLLSMKLRS